MKLKATISMGLNVSLFVQRIKAFSSAGGGYPAILSNCGKCRQLGETSVHRLVFCSDLVLRSKQVPVDRSQRVTTVCHSLAAVEFENSWAEQGKICHLTIRVTFSTTRPGTYVSLIVRWEQFPCIPNSF